MTTRNKNNALWPSILTPDECRELHTIRQSLPALTVPEARALMAKSHKLHKHLIEAEVLAHLIARATLSPDKALITLPSGTICPKSPSAYRGYLIESVLERLNLLAPVTADPDADYLLWDEQSADRCTTLNNYYRAHRDFFAMLRQLQAEPIPNVIEAVGAYADLYFTERELIALLIVQGVRRRDSRSFAGVAGRRQSASQL